MMNKEEINIDKNKPTPTRKLTTTELDDMRQGYVRVSRTGALKHNKPFSKIDGSLLNA